jgi:hypothetical protein
MQPLCRHAVCCCALVWMLQHTQVLVQLPVRNEGSHQLHRALLQQVLPVQFSTLQQQATAVQQL